MPALKCFCLSLKDEQLFLDCSILNYSKLNWPTPYILLNNYTWFTIYGERVSDGEIETERGRERVRHDIWKHFIPMWFLCLFIMKCTGLNRNALHRLYPRQYRQTISVKSGTKSVLNWVHWNILNYTNAFFNMKMLQIGNESSDDCYDLTLTPQYVWDWLHHSLTDLFWLRTVNWVKHHFMRSRNAL